LEEEKKSTVPAPKNGFRPGNGKGDEKQLGKKRAQVARNPVVEGGINPDSEWGLKIMWRKGRGGTYRRTRRAGKKCKSDRKGGGGGEKRLKVESKSL